MAFVKTEMWCNMNQPRKIPQIWSDGAAQPWHLMAPRVFRYDNHEHIDEFFETGRLRLSTFQQFRSYADEVRGDTSEGVAVSRGIAANGLEVWLLHRTGINALIYCTSQLLSRSLMTAFGRSHAFEIADTTGFGKAVGEALGQNFIAGMEGPCIYRGERTIQRSLGRDVSPEFMSPDEVRQLANELGGQEEMLFLKLPHHKRQQEYRLIWAMANEMLEPIFVDCPEAVEHCRRVEADEIN